MEAESTPPIISNPADFTYYQGATGNQINWTVGDKNPGTYKITVNGILDTTDNWTNGTISFIVDGLDLGVHTIVLNVYDLYDNIVSDTVVVEVTEIIPPSISSPDDINYEMGVTGNQIDWSAGDKNPSVLNVTIDGVLHYSDTWTNGTISVNVDGLEVGAHEIVIFIYDLYGNMASDTVIVTVTEISDTTNTDTSTSPGIEETNTAASPVQSIIFLFSLAIVAYLRRKNQFVREFHL